MAKFHLYYLKGRAVVGSDDIDAENALEAVRIARYLAGGRGVEIWNAHSLIQTLQPAEPASLTLADPVRL